MVTNHAIRVFSTIDLSIIQLVNIRMPRTAHLKDEIRQDKPFRSLSIEAVLGLWRTSDILHRHMGAAVEPSGLTLSQYNVLRILRGAGDGGLPTLEIAGRMVEHAPGITRLIDRLEAKGLVTRSRRSDDRRVVRCVITGTGQRLLKGLDAGVNTADDEALAMLSTGEQRGLIELLERVRASHENGSDQAK